MPNHVVNHISLQGDPEKIRSMLETIKSDEHGIGSVDFNKIIPMSKSLDIEAGSRTDRGLKVYRDFIDVYTLAGTMNMDKLRNIPVESEEIFLRQRTDIRRDEWELGKAAWRNIRDFGARHGTIGASRIGEPNGMPMDTVRIPSTTMTATHCISKRHGLRRIPFSKS